MWRVLLIAIFIVSVCFAQNKDTIKPIIQTPTQKIDLSNIKPKAKTNWSKIKDLFL
jgi:hypothetical protein